MIELSSTLDKPLPTDSAETAAAKIERAAILPFRLGEKWYAAFASIVNEVTLLENYSSLTFAPKWLFGIVHHRSEAIAIINLPDILEDDYVDYPLPASKLIILEPDNELVLLPIGLLANEVEPLVTISVNDCNPITTGGDLNFAEVIVDSKKLILIDHLQLYRKLAVGY
ncbi:MAG TPA: chemotaxis protein CheW [Pyrinomonadaceae bacterium]|nr:chemotaxis protein CheW [Pyrinomonadaceae bacterium]